MRAMRWLAVCGLISVLAGGAWARERKEEKPKQTKPPAAEVTQEGKLLVIRGLRGGEPQLTADDSRRWLLTGGLREELLKLEGHRLKVWGTPAEKKMLMSALEVSRYDLLEAGGSRPLVGQLRRDDKRELVLERKEGALSISCSRPLRAKLEKRVGCKVWVVGELEGTTLKANKYGWISCTTPKTIKTEKETKR